MPSILDPGCHLLFDQQALTSGGSPFLSPEIDLGCYVRTVSFHVKLENASTPTGNITVEGANDVFIADGPVLDYKDLGITPITLAAVDAQGDDALIFAVDCTTRKVRVRVTCASGSALLNMKAHGKRV